MAETEVLDKNIKKLKEQCGFLFKSLPIGLAITEIGGKILFLNELAEKTLGYAKGELVSKNSKIFYVDLKGRKKLIMILRKNGKVQNFEIAVKRKNGEQFYCLMDMRLMTLGNKKVVLTLVRDISLKKKAEEELKESEKKYRNVTEKANDGIVIIQDRMIKYGNPALAKFRGDSLNNIINHGFLEFIAPEEIKIIKDYYYKRLRGIKVPSRYETVFLRKNGDKLYAELNAELIQYGGKPADLVIMRDITEKKRAEEKLKQSEAKNRGIISSLGDLLFVFDKIGRFTFYHGSKLELYSSPERFLGKSYLEVMPEEVNKLLKKSFNQNKAGKISEFEYSLNIGTKIRYYYAKISPLLLNNQFEGSVALVRDITENKLAEESIKHLASFPRLSPSPVIETDRSGKVVFYNKISIKLLERLKFDKASGQINENEFLELINSTKFWENKIGVSREINVDDTIYEVYIYPFEEFNTIRLYANDITEKKRAEEKLLVYVKNVEKTVEERTKELSESEREYRELVTSMKEGIYSTDGKGKFLKVNKAMENIFGYDSDEILKIYPWELAASEIQQEIKQKFIEKIIQKDFSPIEIECQKKDGKRFFAEIRISSITPKGGTFGLVLDVTQRKEFELEENLKRLNLAYQELQTLDQMKSDFLSITSHEIKTPITPLIIQTEILQRGDFGKLNDKQLESVNVIYRNINRLNKLITDLLELSRAQSGRIKLDKKLEDVNLLIDKSIETMQKESELKNIKINTQLEKLPRISIDAGKITQVIINLLSNAIKFGKRSGNIWIRSYEKDDNLFVTIKDDGLGIKKLDLEKIFKPFTQLGKIETKAKGSGLGLSICKDLIELHGGKIWVESPGIGNGTTFYFSLPLKEKASEDKK